MERKKKNRSTVWRWKSGVSRQLILRNFYFVALSSRFFELFDFGIYLAYCFFAKQHESRVRIVVTINFSIRGHSRLIDCSLKSIRRYLGLMGSQDNFVLISPGRIVSLRYFYIVILERSRAIRRARTNSKMNKRQSAGKGREEKFEIRVQSRLAF